MEGLELRGTGLILFLGKLPRRKQHCVYFQDGATVYPIAFIPKNKLPEAQRLWARFIGSIQVGDPRSATETK